LDIGAHAIGACTANRFYWKVNKGACLLAQWSRDDKRFRTKLFDSSKMRRVKDGATLKIQFGKIVRVFTY